MPGHQLYAMTRCAGSTSSCSSETGDQGCPTPAPDSFASLQAIVDDYRARYEHRVASEAAFFGDDGQTIAQAVARAARSELKCGRMHDHQCRPGRKVMARCVAALAGHEALFEAHRDFAAVHASVRHLLTEVEGAGELIVYDIAERIGWRLRLEPQDVYLHRGTRDGAMILRPNLRGKTMKARDLPAELAGLSPANLENLLCIYKAALRSLRDRGLL
jgi:hypothetical protein